MVSNGISQTLHDKATRGEVLSAEEQDRLEAWYANQDKLESKILSTASNETSVDKLQEQIDATLTQLLAVTKRIQETTTENKMLRQEIVALRRQLVNTATM